MIFYLLDNLALNKPSYQLSRYKGLSEDLSEAGNAVDGLKSNLSVWGGQCVISENEMETAVWYVDLQNTLSIHHITIYYRTGNEPWGKSKSSEYATVYFCQNFHVFINCPTNFDKITMNHFKKTFNLTTLFFHFSLVD